MRFVVVVFLVLMSCGQTDSDTKKQIAQQLGADIEELNSKTYYSFDVHTGKLKGNSFVTPSHVQTANGFRYGGDSKIELLDITFVNPQQGNSIFKVRFKNEKVQSFNPETGSEFVLSVINDGQKYTLKSKTGTIKIIEFIDNKASFDDNRGGFADERRLELSFEGIFVDETSNEDVNVTGQLQYVGTF